MTFASCNCPAPSEIPAISAFTCGENLGQVQKLIFQRRQSAVPFATLDDALGGAAAIASWEVFLSAADSTKAQITPFFENLIIPAVEAITEGGDDNTTLDGTPIVVGASTIAVTGNFRSLPSEILKELKEYACESDLTVYMVNEFGKIIGDSTGVDFKGIPITEFFIGDGGNDGKNTQDKTMFRFNLRYGWRDNLKFVTPVDFDARLDLNNA